MQAIKLNKHMLGRISSAINLYANEFSPNDMDELFEMADKFSDLKNSITEPSYIMIAVISQNELAEEVNEIRNGGIE